MYIFVFMKENKRLDRLPLATLPPLSLFNKKGMKKSSLAGENYSISFFQVENISGLIRREVDIRGSEVQGERKAELHDRRRRRRRC